MKFYLTSDFIEIYRHRLSVILYAEHPMLNAHVSVKKIGSLKIYLTLSMWGGAHDQKCFVTELSHTVTEKKNCQERCALLLQNNVIAMS